MRRYETAAVIVTALALALTVGYHAGRVRRAPEVTVQTVTRTEPAAADRAAPEELVDLNTADAAALMTLKGVGEVLAERIIADREANGPFRRVEDVTRVRGIGSAILEQNWARLRVSEEAP